MRIDSAKLFEGAKFVNLTIDSGASFPGLPDAGELFFNTTDDSLYFYNGTTWVKPGGGTGAQIHVGDEPPSSTADFPLWWNTDFGAFLFWYEDDDSAQWVEIASGSAGSGGGVNVNPATPQEGDIQIVGSVISIYADNSWRQVFPAVYS